MSNDLSRRQTPQPTGPNGNRQKAAGSVLGGEAVYHYLSDLLKYLVRFEGEATPFGRLEDIGIVTTVPYPFVAGLRVKSRNREVRGDYPWVAVSEISTSQRVVTLRRNGVPPVAVDFWLKQDVLDDQVIDVSGAKVVRVNDLHLLHAEGRMLVVHADVGILGILRRLGYERVVTGLLRWLFDYTPKKALVSWRFVELVSSGGTPAHVRVAGAPSRLAEMHPAEIADILEQLGANESQQVLNALPLETAAETLEEVDPELQRALISQQEPGKAADILEEMNSTEAADVLRDLHSSEAQQIIGRMEREAAEDIRAILSHEEKSAGGIMSTACIEVRPDQLAGEALQQVRSAAEEADVINVIFVLDEARRLLGVVSLREILIASPDAPIRSFMTTDVVKVKPEASLEEVAGIFVKYAFRAVPVVDEANAFLGAVRLMNVLVKLSRFFRE